MDVTIAIPTYNGAQYLDELLTACERQDAKLSYEILVIDSGSRDETLAIVGRHASVRVETIPNAEFGHGRTRNLAVSLALGNIVAFLTQDAVPADDHWLQELVAPFDDPRVGCAYARQQPRPTCQPIVKHDVLRWFSRLEAPVHRVVCGPVLDAPGPERDARMFFSNVSSAVRGTAVRDIPFRDLDYAEDRALAEDLLAAGWCKVYAPSAIVLHSHDLGLRPYFRRMYEEARGLRLAGAPVNDGYLRLVLGAMAGTLRDWAFVLRDPAYRPIKKLRWIVAVPLFQAARRVAIRRSRRVGPPR